MRSIRIATVILALTASPLLAQDAGDREAVADAVAAFEADFVANDMAGIMEVMPPTILAVISERFGLEPEALREMMVTQMEVALAEIEIEAFAMDVDGARFGTGSEGRPYALIPTTTTVVAPEVGEVRSENTTLALEEDGTWYLVRIDQPQQVALLREAFPDLADVELELGEMELVE